MTDEMHAYFASEAAKINLSDRTGVASRAEFARTVYRFSCRFLNNAR